MTRTDAPTADHRARLMAGMAAAVAEAGYASLTVADVVRHARVSKRTFYEHFRSKEECLLALYEAESERLLEAIARAQREARGAEAKLRAGVGTYLAGLQASPAVAQALLVEILAAGPAGLAVRRAVNRRFAELFRGGAEGVEGVPALSGALATALVGGINELLLEAAEESRVDRLEELEGPVLELLRAVLGGRD